MSEPPPLTRLAGWLAVLAMAANLCAGMAAAPAASESPAEAPACRCGEACACGDSCACAVAPAQPAEHRPETPAPSTIATKTVPFGMPVERSVTIAWPVPSADASPPPTTSPAFAAGQRETRLRTGICTT